MAPTEQGSRDGVPNLAMFLWLVGNSSENDIFDAHVALRTSELGLIWFASSDGRPAEKWMMINDGNCGCVRKIRSV